MNNINIGNAGELERREFTVGVPMSNVKDYDILCINKNGKQFALIEGKSLYYYWYKMNKTEREAAIKELIDILKDIHNSKCEPYNWTN